MSGLYLHIPFCASKCAYCDFYSRPERDPRRVEAYVDRMLDEFGRRRGEISGRFGTVYIGGGTPSLLPPAMLSRIWDALPSEGIAEYTIEANPDQITPRFLDMIAASPVDRLSVGIQSFDDAELSAVGRSHSSAQALEALRQIAGRGPGNYSCDLIFGLPGQTPESWRRNLETLMEFRPPHFSAYMLSWEPGTRLYARMTAGKIRPADDEVLAGMYDLLCETARRHGYHHYEISNFAIPGRESVHNTNYWRGIPYLGIGASAHSFDGISRRSNPASLAEYMRGGGIVTETPDADERHNERVMTALRRACGIDLSEFAAEFGDEAAGRLGRLSRGPVSRGLMAIEAGRLRFTERGWLLSDAVLVDLFV
ncbi:MAG: radical SAM family heme chaperone HemW [Clostridium sp.]|nr:radical SAM family heme chaperone HemW [Clostridium sp.]